MVIFMTSLIFPHCLVKLLQWPVVCLSSRRIATDGWTFDLKCLCKGPMDLYVFIHAYLYPFVPTHKSWWFIVEHEHNFSKFYQITISFLVLQFCTIESSFFCVSSSDNWLISQYSSSLIKVVLNPQIRRHSSNHISTQNELMCKWFMTMPCANLIIDRLRTKKLNKRAIPLLKTIQNNRPTLCL